jgi:hypothetical protein
VQELFQYGRVTITNPAGAGCTQSGNPPAGFAMNVTIDGVANVGQLYPAPAPGSSTTTRFDLSSQLNQLKFPEPGGAGSTHTASVLIEDNCDGADHLTVDFTFDVLGFR